MIKIYGLKIEDEIIYIGKTKLTLKRRKGSANYSVPIHIYKASTIFLIEETEDVSRERFWIDYYIQAGCNLYNKRNGDYNEDTRKEQQKKKALEYYYKNKDWISEKSKTYYKDNKERIIKRQLEYNARNRDAHNERQRIWKQKQSHKFSL